MSITTKICSQPTYRQLSDEWLAAHEAYMKTGAAQSVEEVEANGRLARASDEAYNRLMDRIEAIHTFELSNERLAELRASCPLGKSWLEVLDAEYLMSIAEVHEYNKPMDNDELFSLHGVDVVEPDPRLDPENDEAMKSNAQHEWEREQ